MPDDIRGARHDEATYQEWARLIRENDDFQNRLGQALARRYEDVEPSPNVEGKIYEGFATPDDQGRMEQFHDLPWQERHALCDRLDDARFADPSQRRAGAASRHRAMVSARMDLACHTLPLRSGAVVQAELSSVLLCWWRLADRPAVQ